MAEKAWSAEEFTANVKAVGEAQYHDKHPFHRWMNDGKLDREQLKIWVANRFYYQKAIPIKDALFLSKCPVREIRRRWIQRILNHDGTPETPGGIEKWLRLGEGIGVSREQMESGELILPGVKYAVDAYVEYVRTQPWVQAAASSLSELFAPALHAKRLAAFEEHYTWVDDDALAYFRSRMAQAPQDTKHALEIVHEYCTTREEQERTVATVQFKCDTLWAQLDVIYFHCAAPTSAESDAGALRGR